MINILHISPNFNLACGVSKHVFTLLNSAELKKEFNLYFITNGGDALFKLDKANVNYSILEFKTDKIFQLGLFKNKRELEKFCSEKEIRLIHSHHRYPEYLSNAIKKSRRVKTAITVHNFVKKFKHFSYQSDQIIAINNTVKDHLIRNFDIKEERIDVIYNCIEQKIIQTLEKTELKNRMNIAPGCSVLLYLGRLSSEKRIDLLIDAFDVLLKKGENSVLLIVGSGKYETDSDKFSDPDKIKILSPVESVENMYSIADVVILPSDKEPFGYTMLEAGIYKIPFIGSRAGGISEFIEDGTNGYLFEPGNVEDLSKKIQFVIDHPLEANNSAMKLNEKVLRLCNCENHFEKLSSIYDKLLDDL